MKELSIEEKARRYDGAIKRLEDIETGKCQKTFMFTEGLFDYIFPELKESEDEKIRKELLALVKQRPAGFPNYKKYIAWLEKQGEQKPTCSEEDERERKRIIGLLEGWLSTFKETCYAEDCKCGIVWLKSFRPQPKQKWTREDEINRDLIYNALNQVYDLEHNKSLCDWLNSLSPQTWNISDEELEQAKKDAFNDTLDKMTGKREQFKFDDGWSAAIDFVRKKFLCPQVGWKPSERQMKELRNAVGTVGVNHVVLASLISDLEKLT